MSVDDDVVVFNPANDGKLSNDDDYQPAATYGRWPETGVLLSAVAY